MKIKRFMFLWVPLLHFLCVGYCFGTCQKPNIKVPVDFSFKDSQYQIDWIYRSLDPRLSFAGQTVVPDTLSTDGGKLSLTFCLPGNVTGDRLIFSFGPRQLSTSVRPVASDGAMAPVLFLLQSPPNWLIVRSATWDVAADGSPLITVSIYNTSNVGAAQTGPSVHLLLTQGPMSCFGEPDSQQVDVKVSVHDNAPTVISKDEPFPDPVRRSASIASEGCDVNADLELGTTKEVKGNSSLIVRFKLSGKKLMYRMTNGTNLDLYSWADVPGRVALFKGDDVFPKCMSLDQGGRSVPIAVLGLRSCGQ